MARYRVGDTYNNGGKLKAATVKEFKRFGHSDARIGQRELFDKCQTAFLILLRFCPLIRLRVSRLVPRNEAIYFKGIRLDRWL
jgi:hypothetical protein